MMNYTASEIETMARTFTSRQSEALSALDLSFKTDGEIFEAVLDQVADNLPLSEAGWDLFASTARLQFYSFDVTADVRSQWREVADAARDEIFAAAREDDKLQAADHRVDLMREAV